MRLQPPGDADAGAGYRSARATTDVMPFKDEGRSSSSPAHTSSYSARKCQNSILRTPNAMIATDMRRRVYDLDAGGEEPPKSSITWWRATATLSPTTRR
ncbi:cytochrome c-type biogenesis protein CcmH [Salmonella enterica subsp. enterica]|nr:cytochrome c-type biogenesis protein CcmH [Salmonella enterica subsp. enterica]